jgi:hypothetical protein
MIDASFGRDSGRPVPLADTVCGRRIRRDLHIASRYANGRLEWLFQKYARMMTLATAA